MHQQERPDADQPDQDGDDCRDGGVGAHGAEPRPPAVTHQAERQPVPQNEKIGRADAEHHRRMPVEPVLQPAPARQRQIFAHCQCVDIADAAVLQISRGRVMNGMRPLPEIVRRHGEHAERAADPVVGEAMAEERAVPAIVLDHEQPHQESRGRYGEQQGQPPKAEVIGRPHRDPEQHKRPEGDAELERAAGSAGVAVAVENLAQGACVDRLSRSGGTLSIVQAIVLCEYKRCAGRAAAGLSHLRTSLFHGNNRLTDYQGYFVSATGQSSIWQRPARQLTTGDQA